MKPLRRYVRVRLHRRIFLWFGVSIALTLLAVTAMYGLSSANPWRDELVRAERFVGNRFAAVWTEPGARAELTAALARDVDASATVYDADGAVLDRVGADCDRIAYRIAVTAPSGTLGRVELCRDHRRRRGAWLFFLSIFVAGACLWLASGVIARRLIRPLGRVVAVARDIGDGKLDSRVVIGRRHCADELGVLGRAINDMAVRIEKQIDDQRELLAAVSHELRTPLGHMRVLLELLRDKIDDAAQHGQLDELEREVLEIDSLVGQLLASSRLAFDTLDRRPLDAAEVAARALERAGLEPSLLTVQADDVAVDGDA
ncbi:MAG: histidine kinase dimerization/phospho-acceptor domain-containing protein, partial [Myxococcota bacterium]